MYIYTCICVWCQVRPPPPIWYGLDLGAPRRGQRKGPKITDSRGDLRKKSTKKGPRSARKGAQNHRGAEGQPRQDRKTSKIQANMNKISATTPKKQQKGTKSAPRAPTTTERAEARPQPQPRTITMARGGWGPTGLCAYLNISG